MKAAKARREAPKRKVVVGNPYEKRKRVASSFRIQSVSPREILAAKAVESNNMASWGGGAELGRSEGRGVYRSGYDPLMDAFGGGFEERIRPSFAFGGGSIDGGGANMQHHGASKMREDVEDAFF